MHEVTDATPILRAMFAVNRKPYCVYIVDGKKQNLSFLKSIDHGYFEFIPNLLLDRDFEDARDEKRASVLLRISYLHALETFFTVLMAALQAPHCPAAYFLKISNIELREIVESVQKNRAKFYSPHKKFDQTWEGIARAVLPFLINREAGEQKIKKFAGAWQRFAEEFLQESAVQEYNSLKHGLRAKAGGFYLSMSPERADGIPDESERKELGGSKYGSSFPVTKSFSHLSGQSAKINFQVGERHVNWSIDNIVSGLQLLSWSIQNVVSFIRVQNGESGDVVKVVVPEDISAFDKPFESVIGISNLSFNVGIKDEVVKGFTADELMNALDSWENK